MSCANCTIGWHHRCKKAVPVQNEDGLFACCCAEESQPRSVFAIPRQKENHLVKDVTSTGRKRAVKIKKIDKENPAVCEWAYLAKAGGGVEPIVGCAGNPQQNVHHGPDKDTLNNDLLNLHAICSPCHNRWHAKNDPYYESERPPAGEAYLPKPEFEWVMHDPETKIPLADLMKIEGERLAKK